MALTESPSFSRYGKVDPHNASADNVVPVARCLSVGPRSNEQTNDSRRRLLIIGLLSAFLVVVLCVAIAVPLIRKNNNSDEHSAQMASNNINTLCASTLYPDECQQSLTDNGFDNTTSDPQTLVNRSVLVSLNSVTQLAKAVDTLASNETDPDVLAALEDCQTLLDDAQDNLNITKDSLSTLSLSDLLTQFGDDLSNFMSTALTDKTTCLDGFEGLANGTAKNILSQDGLLVEKYLSNALTLVSRITTLGSDLSTWQAGLTSRGLFQRHLLEGSDDTLGYPKWFESANRRLLSSNDFTVDAVVATDGTGHYRTIQAAVDNAPTWSSNRYVIYIRGGQYHEQVSVDKNKTFIMFAGDGVGNTVITGNLNIRMPGVTTFRSATLRITGANFIGRDFTVRNEAGPENFQAVAMRVSADKAAFYQISVEAYQDTLYAHSQRQFYKDSTIQGTVDYIFGNGAIIFQTCSLLIRLPLIGQQNTVTAQGRTDPSQNTGFAFYDCYVDGDPVLQKQQATVASFLGRPWKLYSRTVFIRSHLGAVINPSGWLIWLGDWGLKTCYYAEYQNVGLGADVQQRVSWSQQIRSASEANRFSISKFIGGNRWLPATNIPYGSTTV